MRRRHRVVTGLLAVISIAALGSAVATPSAAAAVGPQRSEASSYRSPKAVAVTPIGAGDEMVTGRGDGDGWHLYAAAASGRWAMRPLATLLPHGGDGSGERWIGRQCLTGDGRHVVAVVAPWSANNTPDGMDRGGLAYTVDAHTGAVRALVGGVSLHYFTPSCGPGSTATLTRYEGPDERTTQLVSVDAASASVRVTRTVAGQVTGAVPAPDGGFFAARGGDVVHIPAAGREAVRARTTGTPFDLVANSAGGADFLVGTGRDQATVWHLNATSAHQVGTGSFYDLALFTGRSGHTLATGVTRVDKAAGIHALPVASVGRNAPVDAVSLDGTTVSPAPVAGQETPTRRSGPGGGPQTPILVKVLGHRSSATTSWIPDVTAPTSTAFPRILRDDGSLTPRVAPGSARPTTSVKAAVAGTPPYESRCAVARNDVHLQTMQPTAQMIDWAAHLAGNSQLVGQYSRPANYANLNLPSGYSPSSDFPLSAPFGPQNGGQNIPGLVLDAIFAQESNFKQASPHSPAGVAGNPYIADYYAAGGGYQVGAVTDSTGPNPDCGYGLGQVTSGMRTGQISNDRQRKVAVDYAENAAAAAQLLSQKWKELSDAGITANNSDPSILENWFLALWDYNSGLHPNGGGAWGLGWTNNPASPAYPYNRHPFLHTNTHLPGWDITYDDAAHPGNWPYEEKILGWMQVPIEDSASGHYAYTGTLAFFNGLVNVVRSDHYELAQPGRLDFCDTAKNRCNSSFCDKLDPVLGRNCDPSATQGQGPCTLDSLQCWWHDPASWCNFLTNVCHGEDTPGILYNGPPEPQPTAPYPPVCDTTVPAGTVIVDSQPSGVNLQGCNPSTANWRNAGSFAFEYGDPADPSAQATDMDLHQLGAGLGGHMWFTHTNEPLDRNDTSYWGLTGSWTPALPALGNYTVKVFVPQIGATATQARYAVDPGYGKPVTITVNQYLYADAWVTLGTFWLGEHAHVSLSNLGTSTSGDLAFSGMSFTPAAGAAPYAILGDSISSGEGTNNYDADTDTSTNSCHRSPDAFGRVYAAGSSAFANGAVEHLACSGATTENILTTARNDEPPQIDELAADARFVTVTVGANDVNFAGVLTRCVTPLVSCEDYYTRNDANNVDTAIENLRGTLAKTYTAIRNKAPSATVVAVTYANIFSPGTEGKSGQTCLSIGAIGRSDVEWLIRETFHLDNVIEAAAGDAGIAFLDERYAFTGHELCTGRPWVNSLLSPPITDISKAFHPNSAGYAQIATDLAASAVAPAGAGSVRARTAPAALGNATWGGWRNSTMANRLPTTTKALEMFKKLIAANPSNSSYHESYFGDWSTEPPSAPRCDRRTLVLERDADATPPTQHAPDPPCEISWGQWQSPYNDPAAANRGTVSGDPRTVLGGNQSPVDVDHIVSKKDAWLSGADQWIGNQLNPNQDRNDFANDSDGLELLTVSIGTNRSKGSRTPDDWTPDKSGNPAFTCDFLKMYVAVKWQYDLTVTGPTWNTIDSRLTTAACGP